jgi:hypothetical protein
MWINGKWVGPVMELEGGGAGGAGGGAPASWRDALPAELRSSPSLSKFNDVSTLAKSYTELETLQGSSIRIPGPDAGEDVRKGFLEKLQAKVPELVLVPNDQTKLAEVEDHLFGRLGRPGDEKQYKLPEDLPHDLQLTDAEQTTLRAAGKGLGLTQKQFGAFVKAHVAEVVEARKAETTATAALKAKWGAAYEERAAAAREAAEKLGVPAEAAKGIPSAQLEVWFNVARAVNGEGGGEGARMGPGAGRGTLAPEEALARAAEIRARKEYWDGSAPNHKALVDEHLKLMKLAYPE